MNTTKRHLLPALLLILALLTLPAFAQTNSTSGNLNSAAGTNLITGPATQVIDFLTQGSNYMIAPYGIITTDGKVGAGIGIGYKVSDFVVPTLRIDALTDQPVSGHQSGPQGVTVWMPSASLQLQAPLTIMGKVTVIPFAFAGIATPVAGKGANNGTPVGIFGAGMAERLGTHWDLIQDFEVWSGFSGNQIRLGVVYKF